MGLDQHFIVDKGLLKEIAKLAELNATDKVLEIGAGHGELTQFLQKQGFVIAVEPDLELADQLKERGWKNVELVEGSALKVWKKLCFNKVIGNVPYSISEPLLWLLLKKPLDRIVLVIGKDFADILLSDSKLGVLAKEFYAIEVVKAIPKKAFFPKPRVDSALIVMTPKPAESKLLRELVLQSDKKVRNALEKTLEGRFTKRELKEKFQVISKIMTKKITQLSNEEFAKLQPIIKKLEKSSLESG